MTKIATRNHFHEKRLTNLETVLVKLVLPSNHDKSKSQWS